MLHLPQTSESVVPINMPQKLKDIEISIGYKTGMALAILIHRGIEMPKEITKRLRMKGKFRKKRANARKASCESQQRLTRPIEDWQRFLKSIGANPVPINK